MLTLRILPSIEGLNQELKGLTASTHIPTDQTSDILSKLRSMNRLMTDLADEHTYCLIFDRILHRLAKQFIEPMGELIAGHSHPKRYLPLTQNQRGTRLYQGQFDGNETIRQFGGI